MKKKIYAYIEKDNTGEWLVVEDTLRRCAIAGEKTVVGVYELKETVEVTLEVREIVVTVPAGKAVHG